MEWFHYNYDMIEAGEIRGERKGKKEEQKYSIRNLYEIALKNDAKNEDVLALIEQKYPEYSSSEIQEILNEYQSRMGNSTEAAAYGMVSLQL